MIAIDMEMPKSCSECPLFNGEFGECQHLGFNVNNAIKTDFTEEREPNCPLKEVPSGEWKHIPHIYGVAYCSNCDFELTIDDTNYCSNCGAKMVEEQESEEQA